jgi:DNA polymerase-3 subunit epsilon
VSGQFSALINPGRRLDPRAAAVNGISLDMLRNAPPFADVVDQITRLIDGSVLIAHNAPFDLAFLSSELALLHRPAPANYVIDTLRLARRLLPRRASYSLGALASDLSLPSTPAHRAQQDVLAHRELFGYLYQQLAAMGIITLGEVLRRERGLLPGQPEPEPPSLIEHALRSRRRLRIVYRSRSHPEPLERVVRPLEITSEQAGLFLRAYCYLRQDMRSFAINKIEAMELANEDGDEDEDEGHGTGTG